MHYFKVGDAVRLKSGGPTMIVNKVTGDLVRCVWLSKNRESVICSQFLEFSKPTSEKKRLTVVKSK
ncbi:DUF2158 domain-containing protein [Fulvivirgaceae bacterium BMA10]|uniref:DUF2158 domain-containing protein n=1 Tax=Splendidivirga corallicola TaxID=3051826 RepID=A0ABT8KWS6_9BACT|nr:DUF2158 domain-containing protein [Fulvivirgaceae bacterium BMA10]